MNVGETIAMKEGSNKQAERVRWQAIERARKPYLLCFFPPLLYLFFTALIFFIVAFSQASSLFFRVLHRARVHRPFLASSLSQHILDAFQLFVCVYSLKSYPQTNFFSISFCCFFFFIEKRSFFFFLTFLCGSKNVIMKFFTSFVLISPLSIFHIYSYLFIMIPLCINCSWLEYKKFIFHQELGHHFEYFYEKEKKLLDF